MKTILFVLFLLPSSFCFSDWLVIENGCRVSNQDIIRVPAITVGKTTIGPVWFTRRPDPNFHQFMSSMMDRRIYGALGGLH